VIIRQERVGIEIEIEFSQLRTQHRHFRGPLSFLPPAPFHASPVALSPHASSSTRTPTRTAPSAFQLLGRSLLIAELRAFLFPEIDFITLSTSASVLE
jgi:hypothetical protein